jgi:ribosome biogenesis GTPase
VLAKTGGRYRVLSSGVTLEATLRGRLKRGQEQVLVGDRVTLRSHTDAAVTIEAVEERKSVLRRRTPGRRHGVRLVAANLDQVAVVGAARQPDWAPQLMDRFIAVAAANDLPVAVVINKCDLLEDPAALGRAYERAGYEVLYTSVPAGAGLGELRDLLAGRSSLFTGPTGGRRSHSGRHTTVAAEMYPFAHGGFVVDTPGLRDIGLWGLERAEVEAAFREFRAYVGYCKFDDCRHLHEPGCAVRAATERGEIVASRLDSYRRMLQEAHTAARPWYAGRDR